MQTKKTHNIKFWFYLNSEASKLKNLLISNCSKPDLHSYGKMQLPGSKTKDSSLKDSKGFLDIKWVSQNNILMS